MEINVNDVVTVLEAVGDSWPAAIVLVTVVVGFVAVRALPRLKEITESLKVLRHEMRPNSGKTVRDAVDRIETKLGDLEGAVTEHVEEDRTWKGQVEDLLTRTDG